MCPKPINLKGIAMQPLIFANGRKSLEAAKANIDKFVERELITKGAAVRLHKEYDDALKAWEHRQELEKKSAGITPS
jgi:plasmid maintenance system antidote protein VapI